MTDRVGSLRFHDWQTIEIQPELTNVVEMDQQESQEG